MLVNRLLNVLALCRERLDRLARRFCPLCEFLLVCWPLYLLLCVLLAALCVAAALMTAWWLTALAALAALPVLLGAAYMLHPLPPCPGWEFSRQPLSRDGRAQVVLADTALLTEGRRETLIAVPWTFTDAPRRRPETVSLAVAMAYTAHLLPEDATPLATEAAASLGVQRANLLRLRPIEERGDLGSVPGVIVQDGKGRTAYYAGDPAALAELCDLALDGEARTMTAEDRAYIVEEAARRRSRGGLTVAYASLTAEATGPMFLGMLTLRDAVSDEAVEAVRALLDAGVSLQTQPIDTETPPPMRLAALRQTLGLTDALYEPQIILSPLLMDTRALSIAPSDDRHHRFDAPVLLLLEWFGKLDGWLTQAVALAGPLMFCCVTGPANALCCLAVGVMTAVGLLNADARPGRWQRAGAALLLTGLLLRAVLGIAMPGSGAAMGLYAMTAALTCGLGLSYRPRDGVILIGLSLVALPLGWLLPGISLTAGCVALAAGIAGGVLAARAFRRKG